MIRPLAAALLLTACASAPNDDYETLTHEELVWLLRSRDASDSIRALTERGVKP